ncbi:MAG: hypothetical protein LBK46_01290 [Oscillospiraceae bacterium]|jgi:hypothetical protein|nr:hypothetical protein [Oscillospiraceae bacterium]
MPISFAVYQMRNAQAHDLIVSLYTDLNDPDAFCSGYVEQVNAKHVLLAALTPWGHRDGWLLWRVHDVRQVYTGDEYETRLDLLVKLHDETRAPLLPKPASPDADLAHWLLDWAKCERRTISLLTADDTFTGRVTALDDLRVTMNSFDFFGRVLSAPTVMPLRDVESVTVDTEEERMYDLLHSASDKTEHIPGWRDKEPT